MATADLDESNDAFVWIDGMEIAAPYVAVLTQHGLTDIRSVFAHAAGERLDKAGLASWRQRWRLALRSADGVSHTVYLKRYDRPPLRQQVRRWLTGRRGLSTAGIEWQTIHALSEVGVTTPKPIAFGERMRAGVERRSFLMLAEVGGVSLERWLPVNWQRAVTGAPHRRQRRLIQALAKWIGALHAGGFVHRDLYASHIFLCDDDGAASPRFVLIDLQRVFRPRWRRVRWIVKDLAALWFSTMGSASRSDRLAFWTTYLGVLDAPAWYRRLPGRIARKVRRMHRHHAKHCAKRDVAS